MFCNAIIISGISDEMRQMQDLPASFTMELMLQNVHHDPVLIEPV